MLRCGFIDKVMKLFKTKQNNIYQTAKPSTKDEEYAEKQLHNKVTEEICKSKNIKYRDLISIIAYLKKYGYIKLKDDKKKTNPSECASASFAAVPWMAKRKANYYAGTIDFLMDEGIVCVKKIVDDNVLKLENGIAFYNKLNLLCIDNEYEKVCSCVRAHNGRNIVLKMSVFHARSFTNMNGENRLLKLIKQNPNLKLEILCVGKCSGKYTWEGADSEHFNNAIGTGMLRLYNLAYWYRRQVRMRVVRDKKADTALRCSIIIVDDKMEKCYFRVWRYGEERANYGTTYEAPKESSMALQINQLFDDAFERAIPAKRNFEWFLYWLKRGIKFTVMLCVFAVIQWLVLGKIEVGDNQSGDSILGVFISLLAVEVVEKGLEGIKVRFDR